MVLLLFCLLGISSLLTLFPPPSRQAKSILFVLLGLILVVTAGFRPGYSDYQSYIEAYHNVLAGYSELNEPTFVWISRVAAFFSGDPLLMFVIYACLGVTLKLIAIRRLTEFWFAALTIYLGFYYPLHEMTQIRVGVATGFFLLAIKPICERDLKRFLLFATCAILFHYSAILILFFWFMKNECANRWVLALAIPAGYALYFTGINPAAVMLPIPVIQEKLEIYQELQRQGVDWAVDINVFNLVYLVRILIFYILLWKIDLIRHYAPYAPMLLKIYAVALFVFPAMAAMPVLAGRLYEFFGIVEIILFPALLYTAKPHMVSKLAVVLIGIVLLSITIFYNKLIY